MPAPRSRVRPVVRRALDLAAASLVALPAVPPVVRPRRAALRDVYYHASTAGAAAAGGGGVLLSRGPVPVPRGATRFVCLSDTHLGHRDVDATKAVVAIGWGRAAHRR